jgi:two-component system sensor histidine kinase DegS
MTDPAIPAPTTGPTPAATADETPSATESPASPPDAGPTPAPTLADRVRQDVETLGRELSEIDLLVQQAKVEAGRHETKRAQASDRLGTLTSQISGSDPKEVAELGAQLANLTRRAVLMEAQVEVLEGKAKVLARYRDAVAEIAEQLGATPVRDTGAAGGGAGAEGDGQPSDDPASVTRLLLGAQEDLRREIARAMHDGPAQSLTNIVLQAQIVERIVARDPEQAQAEVRQLIGMVQSTLEATKGFIFDVRPMVLDDLGLVPTLRRTARERGRRAQIPVEFESLGPDRRLSMELESGLFRIMDEALSAFLSGDPDKVSLRLDWGDQQIEARIRADRAVPDSGPVIELPAPEQKRGRGKPAELPPALAAMIEDRKADETAAVEAARLAALVPLPPTAWREIQERAITLGIVAELLDEGTEVRLVTDIAAVPESS